MLFVLCCPSDIICVRCNCGLVFILLKFNLYEISCCTRCPGLCVANMRRVSWCTGCMHLTWEKGGKRRSKFRPNDTQDQVCAHKPTQYFYSIALLATLWKVDRPYCHLDLEAPRDDRSWHLDLETKHGGQEMTEVSTSSDIATPPVCLRCKSDFKCGSPTFISRVTDS